MEAIVSQSVRSEGMSDILPRLGIDEEELVVVVCGGRHFNDDRLLVSVLDEIQDYCGIGLLIQGGASGADALAKSWSAHRGVANFEYQAEWNKHGIAAVPIRNQRMLDEGKPDLVVAFPDGRGTADMMMRALRCGIPRIMVHMDGGYLYGGEKQDCIG